MMKRRAYHLLFLTLVFLTDTQVSAQRCSGALHFRLYENGKEMRMDTARRGVFGETQHKLREHGLQISTFAQNDRPVMALGQTVGEDLLYADLSCEHTWRMVIRKKDKQARRFIEMEIRFQESCDAFLYLDIDFQPGVFELALCSDSVLRPEGGQAPRNQHGIIVTPASWPSLKRN
jgi:hypothetical protein